MSATARESRTRLHPLACWQFRLDAALRKVLTNVSPTARLSRAKRESLIWCVLRSPVFLLVQPGGFLFSRRFEPLLRARLGQTYTAPEWLYCALRTLRNLLGTSPRYLSTPMISRSAAATTLFF